MPNYPTLDLMQMMLQKRAQDAELTGYLRDVIGGQEKFTPTLQRLLAESEQTGKWGGQWSLPARLSMSPFTGTFFDKPSFPARVEEANLTGKWNGQWTPQTRAMLSPYTGTIFDKPSFPSLVEAGNQLGYFGGQPSLSRQLGEGELLGYYQQQPTLLRALGIG